MIIILIGKIENYLGYSIFLEYLGRKITFAYF